MATVADEIGEQFDLQSAMAWEIVVMWTHKDDKGLSPALHIEDAHAEAGRVLRWFKDEMGR